MKTIFLAAGQGQRLRPLTDELPKCMVPYLGKPLLQHSIETQRRAGVENIVVVRGYKGDRIPFGDVTYIENPKFETTNMVHSFFCARKHFDDDILVSYSDIVYTDDLLRPLLKSTAEISVAVDLDWQKLWSLRMEDPLLDAETLKVGKDGLLRELGKKPKSLSEIEGQYLGLILFKKSILAQVQTFYEQLDTNATYDGKNYDNMFFTSFLQMMIDRGFQIKPVFVRGGWLEIDSLQDLKRYEEIQYLKKELSAH
ncbi:MAG: NTP transferase domain-containing protein [Pseudobdellovibrionaceae bacterium]